MYDRFTDGARRTMALADETARQLHCPAIEPAHVLAGMLKAAPRVGTEVLKQLGVNLERTGQELEKAMPTGSSVGQAEAWPHGRFTRQVLELAREQAALLRHNYIGTEHLLLGLLCTPDPTTEAVLQPCALTIDGVRNKVVEILGAGDDGIKLAADPYE